MLYSAEFYLFTISLIFIITYHIYLIFKVKKHPMQTDIGVQQCIRLHWVRHMIQRKGDVLAVQTLRNTLMSTSFFASSAILLVAGILSFAISERNLEDFNHILNILGNKNPHIVLSRLLVLISLFFFAFFNFLLTMRYYNHLGFMINAFSQTNTNQLVEKLLSDTIQRGALHFTLGIRSLMLIFPFGLWLLGPIWLLMGTIILVIVLWQIDYPAYTQHTANFINCTKLEDKL